MGCGPGFTVLGTPTVVSGTAYDLPPEVTNSAEILRTMQREYPPLLRDARIRGKVILRLSVDEGGGVQRVGLEEGSTHPALDELALELARTIEFTPAQAGGESVPVIVRVPMELIPPAPGRAVRREIRR